MTKTIVDEVTDSLLSKFKDDVIKLYKTGIRPPQVFRFYMK